MGVSALAGSELFAIAITSAAGYLRCHDGAVDDSGDASTLVIRSLQLHPPPLARPMRVAGPHAVPRRCIISRPPPVDRCGSGHNRTIERSRFPVRFRLQVVPRERRSCQCYRFSRMKDRTLSESCPTSVRFFPQIIPRRSRRVSSDQLCGAWIRHCSRL